MHNFQFQCWNFHSLSALLFSIGKTSPLQRDSHRFLRCLNTLMLLLSRPRAGAKKKKRKKFNTFFFSPSSFKLRCVVVLCSTTWEIFVHFVMCLIFLEKNFLLLRCVAPMLKTKETFRSTQWVFNRWARKVNFLTKSRLFLNSPPNGAEICACEKIPFNLVIKVAMDSVSVMVQFWL